MAGWHRAKWKHSDNLRNLLLKKYIISISYAGQGKIGVPNSMVNIWKSIHENFSKISELKDKSLNKFLRFYKRLLEMLKFRHYYLPKRAWRRLTFHFDGMILVQIMKIPERNIPARNKANCIISSQLMIHAI